MSQGCESHLLPWWKGPELCACNVLWDSVHAMSHGTLCMQHRMGIWACNVSRSFVHAVSHRALCKQCLTGLCACNVSWGFVHAMSHGEVLRQKKESSYF